MAESDRIRKIINYTNKKEALERARYKESDFTRKSPLSLSNLSKLLIFKEGKTNQMEIYNFFNKISKPEICVTKAALTEQRKKLNPELFIYMNQMLANDIYEEEKIKTLEGTELIPIGVDGSVFEIPNKPRLKEEFGYAEGSNNKTANVVARAQVSGAYDCENDIMLHATINRYGTSEKKLAMEHIDYIKKRYEKQYKNMLFIFDRGYIGIPLLIYLIENEGKYLFRLQEKTYKKEISEMNSIDEEIIIPITNSRRKDIKDEHLKSLACEMKEIKVRIVKVKLDSGETEILLTNVKKEEINTEKMKEIYFKRWNIEKAYDVIKNKLEMESFSGYSKLAVEQDFHAQILLFNMLEDIKKTANKEIKEKQETSIKTYKYEYIVNLNILIGVCRQYLFALAIIGENEQHDKLREDMLKIIKSNLIAIKSGRKNERKWKSNNNRYNTNMRRNV